MAIAYLLGVRGPRVEQEAARQRRIVPFHAAMAAGFWLLMVAYFAGVPGIAIWVAGAGFGALGMWSAYQFYPSNVPFDTLERPVGAKPDRRRNGERTATADEALAMMGAAYGPVGSASAGGAPSPAGGPAPASAYDALAMLDAAHGPLEPAPEPNSDSTAASAQKAQVGAQPLALPDDDTQRPAGRAWSPPPPGSRPAKAPAPTPAPKPAAPATPELPRSVIRCPGCRHQFEAVGQRPLPVTCPHCGRKGLLR